MKKINKRNGVILVDDDMFEKLTSQYTWWIDGRGYVGGYEKPYSKRSTKLKMHRLVIGAKSGEIVDHINGNRSDNRTSNLRLCTKHQNNMHKVNTAGGENKNIVKTKYGYYHVYVALNKKKIWGGSHKTREEALVAREILRERLYGEFA